MYQKNNYSIVSLELHLFFARIMKEHSLFLMAAYTPADASFTKKAEHFLHGFESLLEQAVVLSGGVVGQDVLSSGEVFTPYTARAEQQTQRLTGIRINQNITARQLRLHCRSQNTECADLCQKIHPLNRTALHLLDGLIALKEQTLAQVLSCRMFTLNYPLLLEHIIREAKLYRESLCQLEANGELDAQAMARVDRFWNQIMMEHALFIRGLLDPTENELIETADSYAKEYAALLESSRSAHDKTLSNDSFDTTLRFRDFKAAGAEGIQQCKIRSVILPLLADHVLREANRYIRLMNEQEGY